MTQIKQLAIVALIVCLYVIVIDILGVVAAFVFDVSPSRSVSPGLFYAVWFVGGVFAGFLSFQAAADTIADSPDLDWTLTPNAARHGKTAPGGSLATIAILIFGCSLVWSNGYETGLLFVPDSMPLSLVFFISMAGATMIAYHATQPSPAKPRGGLRR